MAYHEPPPDPYREPPPGRPAHDMNWIWAIPILLLVLVLVWFVALRGDPRTPQDRLDVDLRVPDIEAPVIREERRIEVEVPTTEQPQQPQQGTGRP